MMVTLAALGPMMMPAFPFTRAGLVQEEPELAELEQIFALPRFRVFPLAVIVTPEPVLHCNGSSNCPSVSGPNVAASSVNPQPTSTIRADGNSLTGVARAQP